MARQGSRPQGIGYCDREVLGARAIFIEVQCNFAELGKKQSVCVCKKQSCKKSRTNSYPRDTSLSLKPAQTPLKNGPKPLAKLYNSPKNSRAPTA